MRVLPVSAYPIVGLQACAVKPDLVMASAVGSKAGLVLFTASDLTHESYRWPPDLFFKKKKKVFKTEPCMAQTKQPN